MSSNIFARGVIGVAAMAGLLSLAERAIGADYDYGGQSPGFIPAPIDDKVDFASNWYVRGDLAYAAELFPKLSAAYTSDPALAPAYTLNPSPSVLNSYSAGAGFGYKVNNWFRTDLVLDYRGDVQAVSSGPGKTCITGMGPNPATPPIPPIIITATDNCTPHFNTDMHRWDLLANGYFDIGTWNGFTPYIGAGAGVTWARIKQSVNWTMSNNLPYQVNTDGFYFNWDRSIGSFTYQFAWAVMAGLSIAMTEQAQLDVGYRFLDLGNVTGISGVTGASTTQRVFVNELRAGIRYMID
ncbi:MAG TPA: outer membrane beta-barrel protein [Methylocella sp.]|nr:outer membrane beta-barrel protein [Methylocella sp.]